MESEHDFINHLHSSLSSFSAGLEASRNVWQDSARIRFDQSIAMPHLENLTTYGLGVERARDSARDCMSACDRSESEINESEKNSAAALEHGQTASDYSSNALKCVDQAMAIVERITLMGERASHVIDSLGD